MTSQRIVGKVGDVDFYKAACHGLDGPSSDYLLEAIRPQACMITSMVGKASSKVIERLDAYGTHDR